MNISSWSTLFYQNVVWCNMYTIMCFFFGGWVGGGVQLSLRSTLEWTLGNPPSTTHWIVSFSCGPMGVMNVHQPLGCLVQFNIDKIQINVSVFDPIVMVNLIYLLPQNPFLFVVNVNFTIESKGWKSTRLCPTEVDPFLFPWYFVPLLRTVIHNLPRRDKA